jgi:hypothetical protein
MQRRKVPLFRPTLVRQQQRVGYERSRDAAVRKAEAELERLHEEIRQLPLVQQATNLRRWIDRQRHRAREAKCHDDRPCH